MKILTVPNPKLRITAQPVTKLDKKVFKFIVDLEKQLKKQDNPKGIGLAATQVGKPLRIFATQLANRDRTEYQPLCLFINPEIIKHSSKKSLGITEDEPDLEGCLSIPRLYGPVPRWTWVELKYDVIKDGKLESKTEKFEDFNARVIQHERDHLDGILFTDYILEYDLPIYKENEETKKLEELKDRSVLEIF